MRFIVWDCFKRGGRTGEGAKVKAIPNDAGKAAIGGNPESFGSLFLKPSVSGFDAIANIV
ncbi:hypothetical protein P9A16_34005 [Shinella sp. 838]|uniref:hypothetical protein n=1 Tax=Shinella sp. 838 TaxID=3038164 RepID=UPI002415402D|nr:hypothetical protein [Shinella sp. 838]MDG4676106.1 hypothetical protein [Shinella sp. 838]